MVAARRRKASNADGNGRAFAVLVEEMRGHFKAYGEPLDGVKRTRTASGTRWTG
jgi:hypothetical protein